MSYSACPMDRATEKAFQGHNIEVQSSRGLLELARSARLFENESIEATIGLMAGFRPNSEIIGNFRKMENCYGHFITHQK